MSITNVKNIFSTYTFDDSTEAKNYHRVLFKPGVSVQARELTEMQSNLQRQIDYHGQYSFADGSRVVGGEVALNVDYDYIKVEIQPEINFITNSNIVGLEEIKLDVESDNRFHGAYEFLIHEIILGNQEHFVRDDEILASWKWIDGIRSAWKENKQEMFL
jgi:glucose-6-phosphate 1-dehydrogenase